MKIAVVGSLNMDLSVRVVAPPKPGETIIGEAFTTSCGGKGANQAVGCARLGGEVAMFGCVGSDQFGASLVQSLETAGVNTAHVRWCSGRQSGCALITLGKDSQNSIIVAPGANSLCSREQIMASSALLERAKILLLQLETPVDASLAAAEIVRSAGGTVILDPAPAGQFDEKLMRFVDIITPNQTEAELLTGKTIQSPTDVPRIVAKLYNQWQKTVVLKLGDQGAWWSGGSDPQHIPAFPVSAVDTVAAGDAFNAGMAVALSEGLYFPDALRWGMASGALCVSRHGAQDAMPTRAELSELINSGEPALAVR